MITLEDEVKVGKLANIFAKLLKEKDKIMDGIYMADKILFDETRFEKLLLRMIDSVRVIYLTF